ncbi:keratin, type I cytoskeletal 18-like [Scleropages formosus]|uniref:Keratin, type I cytoskeletal 18-like n=1 Tax=Scleropages formosus TaxID=113540 RepID=A0A0P7TM62_SCLFO|nr:keratin, type I cytoskeletal 18-like [Scleropages formosus]
MSFSVRYASAPRTFSSASASGSPLQRFPRSSASSMFGGAGGVESRISVSSRPALASMYRPEYQASGGGVPRPDDKETMRGLNERLADYLTRVRELEQSNAQLEQQIKEVLRKRGAAVERDWSAYEKPLEELRRQVRDMTMDNARLILQIDNARLAADDFKVNLYTELHWALLELARCRFESEQALRQSVEQDLMGLRKIIDDTSLSRMQLENQIEALKEELAFLKKNHQEEVAQLRSQISDSNVTVEVDSPKASDLSETITKIRRQYEKAAEKSREDTEAWYKKKFDDLAAEVTHNTEALQAGKNEITDLRRQKQTLEIELQTMRNMIHSLEDTLNETEARTARDIDALNQIIIQLETELGQVRAQAERQAADYQVLLSTKTKLEAEIAQYRALLEGVGSGTTDDRVEFSLDQALQAVPQQEGANKSFQPDRVDEIDEPQENE